MRSGLAPVSWTGESLGSDYLIWRHVALLFETFFGSAPGGAFFRPDPHDGAAVAHSGGSRTAPTWGRPKGLSLYEALESQALISRILHFLLSSFFVRLGIPFLRPDPHVLRPTRTGPVKVGRRSSLAARSVVSRPRLDSPERGGTLFVVG